MSNKRIGWGIGILLVAIVFAVSIFGHTNTPATAAITNPPTNLDYLQLSQGLQLPGGPSITTALQGSNIQFIKFGTCTIKADTSITATTTGAAECAFTGVKTGDTVFVTLNASTTLASQYVIKGAVASTTADGFIRFSILNLTGGSAVPAATAGFGSSTAVLILR